MIDVPNETTSFKTASGARYDLFQVGEDWMLTRDCEIPVINLVTGGDMTEVVAQRVFFDAPPTVGQSFYYLIPSHGGCVSTPVVSIETGTQL